MATVQFHTSQVTAIHKMNSKLHRPIKLLQRETEQASKIKKLKCMKNKCGENREGG